MRLRNEGRNALGWLVAVSLGGPCMSQYAGSWGKPFDHQVATEIATDPGVPFGGSLAAMTFYSVGASKVTLGWPKARPPLVVNGEPMTSGRMFNALHMCLIPKGPHRGKVVVWNDRPIIGQPKPFARTVPWYSFQAWAIVDPLAAAGAVQFENFLLPIRPAGLAGASVTTADNLFCAGHAWSRHGDLTIAGGTSWDSAAGILFGTGDTFAFNPGIASAAFPESDEEDPLYATSVGHWSPGPALKSLRWYPTVTHTSRIRRVTSLVPREGEVMLVAGGSSQFPHVSKDPAWNTYEALRILGPTTTRASGLAVDSVVLNGKAVREWTGPGTSKPEEDWLLEYPRLHQLSNGRVFSSGYAPRGAMLDHESPGNWTLSRSQPGTSPPEYSSNWQEIRHDGSSVLMPSSNGTHDVVMRLGGANETPTGSGKEYTTPTTEVSTAGGVWTATPSMPATDGAADGGRVFANVVILPTGALLVVGGQNVQRKTGITTDMLTPLIYADGEWHADVPNPWHAMPRPYHSTAVLLPSGRVLLGGGDARLADYEVYTPYYLLLPESHKPVVEFREARPALNPAFDAYDLDYGASYGMTFDIQASDVALDSVVLMSPGSTTHHSDMHARHVKLDVRLTGGNEMTVTTPKNDHLAPRGLYMMWAVASTGALSDVIWVRLR